MRTLLLVIGAVALFPGCANQRDWRYSPEEAGYDERFPELRATACAKARTIHNASITLASECVLTKEDKTRMRKELQEAICSLRELDKKHRSELAATLPAPAMAQLHTHLLALLEAVAAVRPDGDPEAGARRVREKCDAFVTAQREFEGRVAGRTPKPPAPGEFDVRFKPAGLPVAIDSSGNFSVEVSVPTPVGEVTFERRRADGMKLLVIEYMGRKRFIRLDRDGEIRLTLPGGFNMLDVKTDTATRVLTMRVGSR